MKSAAIVMLFVAGFAFGDDPKTELRRLDSVTWDLKTHTLTWVVQKGTVEKGEFVPSGTDRYEVTPDNATMTVAEEKRGVEHDEAALLHRLLDTLSIYCAQSVVWWDHGEGTPPSPATPSLKPERPTKEKEQVKGLPLGMAEVQARPVNR